VLSVLLLLLLSVRLLLVLLLLLADELLLELAGVEVCAGLVLDCRCRGRRLFWKILLKN
jgi:hypothetical protein